MQQLEIALIVTKSTTHSKVMSLPVRTMAIANDDSVSIFVECLWIVIQKNKLFKGKYGTLVLITLWQCHEKERITFIWSE